METQPQQLGKLLIAIGLGIAVIGAILLLLGKTGLFKLPGDINLEGKNWKIYFPIASCILISTILTLLMWIVNSFRK